MKTNKLPAAAKGGIVLGSAAAKKLAEKSRPKPGAIRAALGELNREPMLEPHEIPIQVILWRILVQPLTPLKTNAGGVIELPDQVQDSEQTLTSVGRILQLGHFAFQSTTQAGLKLFEEPHKPKVGDFVVHQTYAGQEVKLRNGKRLRILIDTEVLAVASDVDSIKNYI